MPELVGSLGVGSLNRYATNSPVAFCPRPKPRFENNFALGITNPPSRVADGIVHFIVRAYDANGVLLLPQLNPPPGTNMLVTLGALPDAPNYTFRSNAVPASIEIEFAILEPQALERFRSLAINTSAARNYLASQSGRVHLFRTRVTLPTAQSPSPAVP